MECREAKKGVHNTWTFNGDFDDPRAPGVLGTGCLSGHFVVVVQEAKVEKTITGRYNFDRPRAINRETDGYDNKM